MVGPGRIQLMACAWLLVDGSSFIFRAYYGSRGSDSPWNAVPAFLERLARLITQRRPRHVVVADDAAWRPDWRVELIPTYKSHRVDEPVPPGLVPQIPVIMKLLACIGVDVIGVADYEAEDVIATLSNLVDGSVEIASGDRDLFALVEDPRVCVLYPEKRGLTVIDEAEVTRRYEIPGRRYADFAMLRGDPSDGLPGLKGVGAVGAAGLIRRYGDVAGLLRERELREADREYLMNAMSLVPPARDLPIAVPRGRRDAYPEDAEGMSALAAEHGAQDACDRLVASLDRLATRPAQSE
jgi:5'-3' exonuclease